MARFFGFAALAAFVALAAFAALAVLVAVFAAFAAWLNQRDLYGDLGEDPRFAESFARQFRLIWSDGTEAALRAYLNA